MTLADAVATHYEAEARAAEEAGDTRTDNQRTFDESLSKHARDLAHSRTHALVADCPGCAP